MPGLDKVPASHVEIAVQDPGAVRVPVQCSGSASKILLRMDIPAKHQVRVGKPGQGVKVLTTFSGAKALIRSNRSGIGIDIRIHDLLPHAELKKNVRWHVQRMCRGWRDVGIDDRRRVGQDRMIRVIERVDDEMRGTRMVRVVLEYLGRYGGRLRLASKAPIAGTHRAEQGQGVENSNLVIVRPAIVHGRHVIRIRVVTG